MTAASNAQRVHYALEQKRFAEQTALTALEKLGLALPCSVVEVSGSIVTVNFEVDASPWTLPKMTIPVATTHYFFQPIQIGETGLTVPADVYISAVAELGGSTPDMTRPPQLGALVFLPVAKKSWVPTDPNKAEVWGPAGAILRNADSSVIITADADSLTFTAHGKTIVMSASGIVIDGILWETHEHTGVQTGTDKTGAPTSP